MPVLTRNYKRVEAARAIGGKRTRYYIEGVQGLLLDVLKSGRRVWYVRYQLKTGSMRRDRSFKIGDASSIDLSKAIIRAKQIMSAVELEGRDPQRERRTPERKPLNVSQLIDEYLKRHVHAKLRPSSVAQYEYRLNAFVRPELGDMGATEVRKRDIIELADSIAEEGKREKRRSGRGSKGGSREGGAPRLADGIVEIVSSMYSWAQKRDMLESNPAFRVAKYSERPRRDRVLTDGEFPIFWMGVVHPKVGEPLPTILRLLLVTGQRRGEIAGARIDELDLDARKPSWTIGAGRTKNGLAHTLPLGPMALKLWRAAIEDFADKEFVFPASRAGVSSHIHPGSITHAMREIRTTCGLDDVRVHDLRRTVRTRMAALRIPREISARLLNHADEYERGVHDESYNRHDYFDEKLDAMEQWEAELALLLKGEGATARTLTVRDVSAGSPFVGEPPGVTTPSPVLHGGGT